MPGIVAMALREWRRSAEPIPVRVGYTASLPNDRHPTRVKRQGRLSVLNYV